MATMDYYSSSAVQDKILFILEHTSGEVMYGMKK